MAAMILVYLNVHRLGFRLRRILTAITILLILQYFGIL